MSNFGELAKGSAALVTQTLLMLNLIVAVVRGTIAGWRDFGALSLVLPFIDIVYITKYTVLNVVDLIRFVA